VFPRTAHVVEDGPACRVSAIAVEQRTELTASNQIWGSMSVKKVTGNLHVVSAGFARLKNYADPSLPLQTTLGHGYLSWEHTDHARSFALPSGLDRLGS